MGKHDSFPAQTAEVVKVDHTDVIDARRHSRLSTAPRFN
jgi:hypothetical protein